MLRMLRSVFIQRCSPIIIIIVLELCEITSTPQQARTPWQRLSRRATQARTLAHHKELWLNLHEKIEQNSDTVFCFRDEKCVRVFLFTYTCNVGWLEALYKLTTMGLYNQIESMKQLVFLALAYVSRCFTKESDANGENYRTFIIVFCFSYVEMMRERWGERVIEMREITRAVTRLRRGTECPLG